MKTIKATRSMGFSLGVTVVIVGLAFYVWVLRMGDKLRGAQLTRVERAV